MFPVISKEFNINLIRIFVFEFQCAELEKVSTVKQIYIYTCFNYILIYLILLF